MMAFAVSSRLSASVALADPSVASAERVNSNRADLSPGQLSGRPCDPFAFRRLYPNRWSEFLRAHFRSITDVQMTFSIDDKTARNWWHGKTGPQGWAVEFARQSIPGAATWMEQAA